MCRRSCRRYGEAAYTGTGTGDSPSYVPGIHIHSCPDHVLEVPSSVPVQRLSIFLPEINLTRRDILTKVVIGPLRFNGSLNNSHN